MPYRNDIPAQPPCAAEAEASRQRLRLKRSLMAQAVYAFCILLQWLGARWA
jgi:hypothetical protein